MGDYYKYKKILVILMIVSCGFSIIKNIFKTKVQASEAVEVTPTWNDGTYTVQADNNYLSIQQSALNIQESIINQLYFKYDNSNNDSYKTYLYNMVKLFSQVIGASSNRTSPRYITFYRVNDSNYSNVTFGFFIFGQNTLDNGSIVQGDATLSDGYKLINQPFYSVYLGQYNYREYINLNNNTTIRFTSGTTSVACAEVGCYSPNWVDLFKHFGVYDNSGEYESALAELQETADLNYTQNYYTKQAVQNTYNYLNSDSVDTISSTGITQPQVTEPDISDAFDSLSDLLTNDNAATKYFTFTLPNGSNHVFALSPDFLRNSLTRVGGGELVTIIETLWYIGLYGLMIFTGLKIIGALLSGDLDAVTGVLSPVNSVVNSSLEVTGAFRTAGGDESAFRIRKG